ncbi:hypothetical protein ACTXT7_017581 [Hymenolepis weldensis]
MSSKRTGMNRLMRAQRLVNKLKCTEEEECLWFFSDEENFHRHQKVNVRNEKWLCVGDPIEVPTIMHAHEVYSNSGNSDVDVDADRDAYMGTLQTIGVKPPWIDSVGNGGRPSMFSNKIRLHPMQLSKPRIRWMGESFHHRVTPNFLCLPNNSPDLNPLHK